MAYDFTLEALTNPERLPAFVRLREVGAFDSKNTGFSLVNAWWLANASQIAYFDRPDLDRELRRAGLELVRFFDDRSGGEKRCGTGTQAFLARAADFALLAFRGTEVEDKNDVLADIQIGTARFDGGARVHRGFLAALDAVWAEMRPLLAGLAAAGTPVWFTGYSLGAALATLAAARHRPAALFTYGSPRVGGEGFGALLDGVPNERFVNCTDIFTTVPAPPVYRHVGRRRFFDAGGALSTEPGPLEVLRARLWGTFLYQAKLPWLQDLVPVRGLADHSIVNYIESIERSMAESAGRIGRHEPVRRSLPRRPVPANRPRAPGSDESSGRLIASR